MSDWTKKDGTKISVKQMETSHIENALAMLKRKGFVSPSIIESYLTCSPPTADMASYYFEQEMDAAFSAPVSKFIDIFEQELGYRHESGN